MYSFVQSLFSACIAGLVVWYLVRRGSSTGGNPASTTAEIERLRVVVEELTAALEQKAEAAEQRLSKLIAEAHAVQGLLDRTLGKVGAQIVRTETPEAAAPAVESTPASIETKPVRPAPVSEPAPSPQSAGEAPIERATTADGPARAGIRPMSAGTEIIDLLSAGASTVRPEPANAAPLTDAASPAPVDTPAPEPQFTAAESDDFQATPIMPSTASESTAETVQPPAPAPVAPPPAKLSTLPGSREPKETAEREARVMSLVARGITNSVEIARETGLTRGEVELILTLHNLHIAPGREGFAPAYTISTPPPERQPDALDTTWAPSSSAEAAPRPEQPEPEPVSINPDDRYAPIYALIAAGITDSVEIARRTGLGRGEVELHMGLHARKVL